MSWGMGKLSTTFRVISSNEQKLFVPPLEEKINVHLPKFSTSKHLAIQLDLDL